MCCHPTGCCSVSSHIRNLLATLNILSHALGSGAPVVTAQHWCWATGSGGGGSAGFLQLPASPHFLSARAMTRLLISIFSPRFITTTTALSGDLPTLIVPGPQRFKTVRRGTEGSLDLWWLLRLETALESQDWTNIYRWSQLVNNFLIDKIGPKPKD